MTLIITLAAICLLLSVFLYITHNSSTELIKENSWLKGRMEEMQVRIVGKEKPSTSELLSADDMVEAIKHEGFVPDKGEDWIRFMVSGEAFYAEIDRLPTVFILRQYIVDTKEWEMDLLRKAAHMMADELIMVKADFSEDGMNLRFFIACLDANKASFQLNLTKYIGLISEAREKMKEIYDQLVKERRDAALALNPFLDESVPGTKVLS